MAENAAARQMGNAGLVKVFMHPFYKKADCMATKKSVELKACCKDTKFTH